VGKVASQDMSYVLDAKREVETAIRELLEKAKSDQAIAANLDKISSRLVIALHEAMRGLQFEDMASQSVRHLLASLSKLDPIAQAMETKTGTLADLQLALADSLQRHSDDSKAANRNPVSASSMQSGDVDLF
jgi:methyl-accepting chemotaxis protein